MKQIIERALGIIFPRTCPVCGQIVLDKNELICIGCRKELKYAREPKCDKCGKPLDSDGALLCTDCKKKRHSFNQGVCIFQHSGSIRKSIYKFKYNNKQEYAEFYAQEAIKIYKRLFEKWKIQIIIPVPIHKKRTLKRGYNQAEVFAKKVSQLCDIGIDSSVLKRLKETKPQKQLTNMMRSANLKNAFGVCVERLENIENVLIIDDIYTTGSTIDECAVTLKKAGVKNVYFLCISAGSGV